MSDGLQKRLDEAMLKQAGESLTQRFITFSDPGDGLIGVFLLQEQVTPNEEMGAVQRYVFLTTDGVSSCLLGGATDRQLAGKLKRGDIVTITYQGKQRIRGGAQQVNLFDVRRTGHLSEDEINKYSSTPELF